jgi:hypothetical protein
VKELSENSKSEETPVNDTESDQTTTHIPKSSSPLPIDNETNSTIVNSDIDSTPSPFTSPIKLEQIIDGEQSTVEKENSSELCYNFLPENFHAEQVRF